MTGIPIRQTQHVTTFVIYDNQHQAIGSEVPCLVVAAIPYTVQAWRNDELAFPIDVSPLAVLFDPCPTIGVEVIPLTTTPRNDELALFIDVAPFVYHFDGRQAIGGKAIRLAETRRDNEFSLAIDESLLVVIHADRRQTVGVELPYLMETRRDDSLDFSRLAAFLAGRRFWRGKILLCVNGVRQRRDQDDSQQNSVDTDELHGQPPGK
jgi:hypothetical protein